MENNANSNPQRMTSVEDSGSQTLYSATYADILKKDKEENIPDNSTTPQDSTDENLNSEAASDIQNENVSNSDVHSSMLKSQSESSNDWKTYSSPQSSSRNGNSMSLEGYESSSLVDEITVNSRDSLEEEVVSELVEDQVLNESQSTSMNTKLSLSGSEQQKRKWVSSSSEESDSFEEDDEASDGLADITDTYPGDCTRWKLRIHNPVLPETVTVLKTKYGGKVYLVGTAHFSMESQEDVAKTIRAAQPDVVTLELCKNRVNILSLDEETILRESRDMNFEKIRTAIRQNGFMQGVLYLLLLNMSANLTKQLGMAPGGEFRRAFTEAKKVPGCVVLLGDRSIHITLKRALSILSLWRKLRIAWYMLTNKDPISKEEVEKCKQRDLLEKTLAEMTGEFPELSKVFVEERDLFLTHSLQKATIPTEIHLTSSGVIAPVVVGVVGIGHVPGIVENWEKVQDDDIPPILCIPEPSMSSRVIGKFIRYSFYGLVLYGGYRILPNSLVRKPVSMIGSYVTGLLDKR